MTMCSPTCWSGRSARVEFENHYYHFKQAVKGMEAARRRQTHLRRCIERRRRMAGPVHLGSEQEEPIDAA
jgi:hypothetical protein